jgi:large subunit ribosomal protein L24
MAAKIKKGDEVIVLTGRDKGRTGKVLEVRPTDNKLVVEGVNIATRHVKPSQLDPQGGLKRTPAALHVSNVALVDPKNGGPTRVGFKVVDGKKVRVAKKSGEVIDG